MSHLAWSVCLRWLSIPASPAKTDEPIEMPVNKFSVVNITYCVRHWLSMPRKNLTHLARTFSQVSTEAFFFYCNYATLLVNNKKIKICGKDSRGPTWNHVLDGKSKLPTRKAFLRKTCADPLKSNIKCGCGPLLNYCRHLSLSSNYSCVFVINSF